MCGERQPEFGPVATSYGSSPRVRGTQPVQQSHARGVRIIPACAGNARRQSVNSVERSDHPRVCGERPPTPRRRRRGTGSSPRVRGTHRTSCHLTSLQTDHPRVCGERNPLVECASGIHGSSPRVRGTRRSRGRARAASWIIPACAGNASENAACIVAAADHPRVCGERSGSASAITVDGGSSPRVRGTRRAEDRRFERCRIIPACAGNASARSRSSWLESDHPRVCGERMPKGIQPGIPCGSSPRVRGTRENVVVDAAQTRIIPACAGNAWHPASIVVRITDHPRVCGERFRPRHPRGSAHGSSPRVRGTPPSRAARSVSSRIIPACAGNAAGRAPSRTWMPDHPRVCGERLKAARATFTFNGSSPRVRGTQIGGGPSFIRVRIIPACAGNAVAIARQRTACADHPRVCGERHAVEANHRAAPGSSPRVRGTPRSRRALRLDHRIIPACAGNAAAASAGA